MHKLKEIDNKILNFLFSIPKFLFINFFRLFIVRIKVFEPKKIPRDRSAIFAFNHTTGADPIIVLGAIRRKIYFMADSERFSNKFTTFFMRKFTNSIPVFKNEFLKNTKSFKELFDISKGKKIFFGIFPEGDLFKKDIFGKFKGGAAYLSYKTRIPIIPVYIHNIHKGPGEDTWCGRHPVFEGISSLFMNTFRRIHIFIGEPIDPMAENILNDFKELTDKNEYKKIINKITKELEEEFTDLKKEANVLFAKNKINKPKTLNSLENKTETPDSYDLEEDNNLIGEINDPIIASLDDDGFVENTGNLK
ncbi:MAG: 1-acyl-sn-glycerol-3-phosphate acyltransferase [Actinobacteria bacterium]|nr:1-acyl-sn-glycerol-3-phosphate acyltransferase [Actinomycetota bacterium]MBM3713186.1 1-acyl-sn-glycerol-3-phosphate acyltransferase [Actinomycetota bacterium]